MFKYVRIPSTLEKAVEECEGDKSGGLENDFLVNHARAYFGDLHKKVTSNGASTTATSDAAAIDALSPSDKKQLAETMREQISKNHAQFSENAKSLDDNTLIEMYKKVSVKGTGGIGGGCDIVVLTVPTSNNKFQAVSMYVDQDADQNVNNINKRAMELMKACGHGCDQRTIYGDVFVGRCHDDEASGTEWERLDFHATEVESESTWCQTARLPQGGGGSGKSGASAHSLGGTLSQTLGQQYIPKASPVIDSGEHVVEANIEKDGIPSYTWSQTEEEVEIKFQLPPSTIAKSVKVKFKSGSIEIVVAGATFVSQTQLHDTIIIDESTYTFQSTTSDTKELCLTLTKRNSNNPWPSVFAIK